MALRTNNAESGLANGTAVTTSNSGGTAGDAMDNLSIGASGNSSLTVTTTNPIQGTRSYLVHHAASEACAWMWTYAAGIGQVSGAMDLDLSDFASAPTTNFQLMIIRGSGSVGARVYMDTSRRLFVQSQATGTTITGMTTSILPTSGTVTLNLVCSTGTTTTDGVIKFQYFLGSSTSAAETFTATNVNTGAGADLTSVQFGCTGASSTWTGDFKIDNLRANDGTTTMLGAVASTSTGSSSSVPSGWAEVRLFSR